MGAADPSHEREPMRHGIREPGGAPRGDGYGRGGATRVVPLTQVMSVSQWASIDGADNREDGAVGARVGHVSK